MSREPAEHKEKKERARSRSLNICKVQGGQLLTSRQGLVHYLEKNVCRRRKTCSYPEDVPPIEQPKHLMVTSPPKWSEVKQAVRQARASAAPVQKPFLTVQKWSGCPSLSVAWDKGIIPRAWHRSSGVLIPKEKDSTNISQFHPICLYPRISV